MDISTILNASDGQEIMITKTIKNIGGFSAGDLRISVRANQDGTLIVTALAAEELSNPDAVTKVGILSRRIVSHPLRVGLRRMKSNRTSPRRIAPRRGNTLPRRIAKRIAWICVGTHPHARTTADTQYTLSPCTTRWQRRAARRSYCSTRARGC